jgi:hypothetical protein
MNKSLTLALALCPVLAHAGAWTRDSGGFYLNASYARISTGTLYAADFSKVPIIPYTQHSVGLYGEVGIVSRWLTAVLDAQVYRRNVLQDQGLTEGLSDVRVGFWTGLLTSPVRLSLGLLFGLPTGDSGPKARPGADSDAQITARSLPTGDGEFDVEARLAFGYSFGIRRWLAHYIVAEAGYWTRTRGFADALTYNFELGIKVPRTFFDRFWIIARFFGVESFASQEEASMTATGLGNGVTYNAFGVQLFGRIWKALGASIGVDSAFRARSIAAGRNLRFTLSFER